jgi:pyrimidine operon attenuation protein/uracil phosphoribosyltransferase
LGHAGFLFASFPPRLSDHGSRGEARRLSFTLKATILDPADMQRAVARIAHEITERNKGARNLVLIGVLTRGVHLAERLADRIESIEGTRPATGALDIGLYRDDIGMRDPVALAPTLVPDIDGKVVVLVDDVLYTGRSARAALDALIDLGRPKAVQLAVLVDRGHRELPIRADYVGKNVPTGRNEEVRVMILERDGQDGVQLGTIDQNAQEAAR